MSLIILLSGLAVLLSAPAEAQDSRSCYDIFQNRDSKGYDLDVLGHGISTFFGGFDEQKSMNECSRKTECQGFNSEGILKYKIRDKREWSDYNGRLYVKVPCVTQKAEAPVKALSAGMISAKLNNKADCFCNTPISTPSEAILMEACTNKRLGAGIRGRGAPGDLLYATYFVQCLDKINFCSKSHQNEYVNECQNADTYARLTASCKNAITPSCVKKPAVATKPMSANLIATKINNKMDCYCEEAAFVPRSSGIQRACKAPNDLLYATHFIECLDSIDFCSEEHEYYESECQDLSSYTALSRACRNAVTPACR